MPVVVSATPVQIVQPVEELVLEVSKDAVVLGGGSSSINWAPKNPVVLALTVTETTSVFAAPPRL